MKINDFAVKVTKLEKGEKEIDIAQTKQILRITDKLVGGELYKAIRAK